MIQAHRAGYWRFFQRSARRQQTHRLAQAHAAAVLAPAAAGEQKQERES
jgi:hypothetical protein